MGIKLLFIITVFSEILLLISLIITLVKPKYRIWPPPRKNSWQFWFTWILMIISTFGVILLGIIDWDSFLLSHWLRYPIGLLLITFGSFIGLWAIKTLSIHSTLGLKGNFITNGPYKYTRNPQYLGDIVIIIGIILLSNSFLALITGILGILWFLIAPFTEEPLLKEQFKEDYNEYCKKVPRFI